MALKTSNKNRRKVEPSINSLSTTEPKSDNKVKYPRVKPDLFGICVAVVVFIILFF